MGNNMLQIRWHGRGGQGAKTAAGMVAEELKAESGDRLAFCGLISTQQTLPHGTVDECRRHARHTIDVMTPGGGYIFAPAHQIQPDTPLENTLAVFEEATGKKFM